MLISNSNAICRKKLLFPYWKVLLYKSKWNFWNHTLIPAIYLWISISGPQCLNYYYFAKCFKIYKCESFRFVVFFSKTIFDILDPLWLLINLKSVYKFIVRFLGHLKARVTEKEENENNQLIDATMGRRKLGRRKPGARSFSRATTQRSKVLGPLAAAFLDALARTWIKSGLELAPILDLALQVVFYPLSQDSPRQ